MSGFALSDASPLPSAVPVKNVPSASGSLPPSFRPRRIFDLSHPFSPLFLFPPDSLFYSFFTYPAETALPSAEGGASTRKQSFLVVVRNNELIFYAWVSGSQGVGGRPSAVGGSGSRESAVKSPEVEKSKEEHQSARTSDTKTPDPKLQTLHSKLELRSWAEGRFQKQYSFPLSSPLYPSYRPPNSSPVRLPQIFYSLPSPETRKPQDSQIPHLSPFRKLYGLIPAEKNFLIFELYPKALGAQLLPSPSWGKGQVEDAPKREQGLPQAKTLPSPFQLAWIQKEKVKPDLYGENASAFLNGTLTLHDDFPLVYAPTEGGLFLLYFLGRNALRIRALSFLTRPGQNLDSHPPEAGFQPCQDPLTLPALRGRPFIQFPESLPFWMGDINRDGLLDYISSRGDRGQLTIYYCRSLKKGKGDAGAVDRQQSTVKPTLQELFREQHFKLNGHILSFYLTDVNHDGYPDLWILFMRKLTIFSGLRALSSHTLNLTAMLFLFDPQKGEFQQQPQWEYSFDQKIFLELGGRLKIINPPLFDGTHDLNGDGYPDVLIGNGDKIQVFLNAKGQLPHDPTYTLTDSWLTQFPLEEFFIASPSSLQNETSRSQKVEESSSREVGQSGSRQLAVGSRGVEKSRIRGVKEEKNREGREQGLERPRLLFLFQKGKEHSAEDGSSTASDGVDHPPPTEKEARHPAELFHFLHVFTFPPP